MAMGYLVRPERGVTHCAKPYQERSKSGGRHRDVKEQRLMDFAAGRIHVLITRQVSPGMGLNWQRTAGTLAFNGRHGLMGGVLPVMRRCPSSAKARYMCTSCQRAKRGSVANLKHKEADAKAMGDALASSH